MTRFAASLLLAALGPIAGAPQAAPALWDGLTPGAHAAGFSVAIEADASRPVEGGARRVQVSCWYPAADTGGQALTYRDYFVLSAGEREPASAAARQAAVAAEKAFFASVGVTGSLVERWLDQPVYARADAPAAAGTFPLVLVAQGNGQSAHHQAILSEWLASHGYVVCTTPSQVRLGTSMTSEADVLPNARAQAADLRIAERYARAHWRVGASAPGLVGHSFGARSALVLASAGSAAALASLDGGIGAKEARDWVDGLGLDPARFTTPILHVYEAGDPAITPDLTLMQRLDRSRRTIVRIDALRHVDFTSLGFGAAAIDGLTGEAPADLPAKVRAIATLVLLFLDSAMKTDDGAFMTRVPPETMDACGEVTTDYTDHDVTTTDSTDYTDQDVTTTEFTDHTDRDVTTTEFTDHTDRDVTTTEFTDYTDQDVTTTEFTDHTDRDVTTTEFTDYTDQDVTTTEFTDHTDRDVTTTEFTDYTDQDVTTTEFTDYTDQDVTTTEFTDHTDRDVTTTEFTDHTDRDVTTTEFTDHTDRDVTTTEFTDHTDREGRTTDCQGTRGAAAERGTLEARITA